MSIVLAALFFATTPLDASLARVPARQSAWKELIAKTPAEEKESVIYLLTYMPIGDLENLPTEKVAEAARLARIARNASPWAKKIPKAIFLNDVVPYASVTEPRQSMRAEFQKRYLPLVKSAKTPGEAALLINETLFKDYKVTYNTKRLRTDQSPPETIAQGMATCTGLSIMLIDVLRAVGVPSRIAGIASWPGRGGNHTWVEVWSAGDWHFLGAAEPDAKGLDHAWFAEEAGQVPGTNKKESIYAVSYKPTGVNFPLVWDTSAIQPAIDVTKRYRKSLAVSKPRLMVEVKLGGERVMAQVVAVNAVNGDKCLTGQSLGPHADINLHLNALAKEGETYKITATYKGKSLTTFAKVKGDTVVRMDLDGDTSDDALNVALAARFNPDSAKEQATERTIAKADFNTATAAAAWLAYKAAPDATMKADFDSNTVKTADRTSPYYWRIVGDKPKDGYGLVIAMHGGGGAPKGVNDAEWQNMFKNYYKDHPEAGGYVYLALRAPNDLWDGFYDTPISPLIERLILQFVKFGGVDPNCIYVTGASHGGYGAFVIAPKIPYRFAAAHAAAGALTPDRTAGENLRNVRFTWSVGERDTAYGRIKLGREFQTSWDGWKKQYGGFDGGFEEVKGHGHLINDTEADKIAELRKYTRNPAPKRVVWVQTDNVLHRFYWLEAVNPVEKGRIEAIIDGNTITLTTEKQGQVAIWLTSNLVDLTKPVVVVRDGKSSTFNVKPSLATFCSGLEQTGDPALSAPVRIII